MSTNQPITVGLLKESELEEAGRIVRLAFGTFLGLPNPLDFMGDRNLMAPRWRSTHVKVIAAREGGRLIGSNVATRWGSFGFFGPLTVLPEYWDRGVAQRLLQATMYDFPPMGRAAHRAVHVPAKRQARGFVPEVRLLAALSNRDHDAHTGG
jgi:GNAT superfamily N-acetyltransferase